MPPDAEVRLPAESAYVGVLRMTTAGIAARLDFTLDDIEDLLRYEALDAVVICSPTHLHESHILAALSAGVHVLVEKPLAMSAASAQRIVRAVEKRQRVVMVGMNHRYRPDVQTVRSFVQGG